MNDPNSAFPEEVKPELWRRYETGGDAVTRSSMPSTHIACRRGAISARTDDWLSH